MISTGSMHTNAHLVLYVSEWTCPATSQQLKTRQAMYCMYSVTVRRVLATFVAVEKQQVLHIMNVCFSVRYPACKEHVPILCVLDRASSWYLNKGWPTRWHLLYYILLNMFQTLIRPSSGACDYLLRCVGWLEACWCYVAGLSVDDVVSECRLNHWWFLFKYQDDARSNTHKNSKSVTNSEICPQDLLRYVLYEPQENTNYFHK